MIKLTDLLNQILSEEKKKTDRCLRIARRKYDKPSAYRSGAIVRCRRGEIWKDVKEEITANPPEKDSALTKLLNIWFKFVGGKELTDFINKVKNVATFGDYKLEFSKGFESPNQFIINISNKEENKYEKVGRFVAFIYKDEETGKYNLQIQKVEIYPKYKGKGIMREFYQQFNEWLKDNFENFDKFTSGSVFLYNKKTGKYDGFNMWEDLVKKGLARRVGPEKNYIPPTTPPSNGMWVLKSGYVLKEENLSEETLNETETRHYVYRVDSQKIPDFTQDMQTYYHTDDFSTSGQFAKGSKIPKEYTGKITGIFAGTKVFTALYATGNADQTRFVAKYSPGQPTVYFDRQDVPRLKDNRSYLTVFDARRFKELPTGEWFSSDPGQPIKQQVISDPFDYITRAGWRIQQIDDLPAMLKRLKAAGVDYGAEGIDEEDYDADSTTPQFLYHATYKPLLKKIKEKGLGTNDIKKAWEDSITGYVYLALDPYVAESYAEESEMVPEDWLDDIIILEIDTNKLDKSKLFTDQNVQDNKGDTLEYRGVIPWEALNLYKSEQLTEEQKETLRTWFKRKGAPGKTGGWVDCNSPIRKDGKITGYKSCGRQKGETRSKYPSCRPTPSKCKDSGKGKKWGKTK